MKVVSIMGTRPEMIKMWSTLKKLDELNFDHIMVHTGQNFTPELKDFFFHDLQMRQPDFNFDIDTSSYANEVADVIVKSEELFRRVKPDALLILGDTYSGLSIMPATQQNIKSFHMEAGLRAYDKRMPEQRNRILIDHMSSILLPFNSYHRENLIRENIHPSKIFVSGNPTFEVMRHFSNDIASSDILQKLELTPSDYILVTAHRAENVDDINNLKKVMSALGQLASSHQKEVVYPMHPRTANKVAELSLPKNLRIIKPLGFYDFNLLLSRSWCVISDSGTASEEALFYNVPCVTLRMSTERPETVEAGGNIISGLEVDDVVSSVKVATSQDRECRYDFNEGFAASSVVVNTIRSKITNFF